MLKALLILIIAALLTALIVLGIVDILRQLQWLGAAILLLATGLITWYTRAGYITAERREWLRTGRCGACGYDLRASPERCPECARKRVHFHRPRAALETPCVPDLSPTTTDRNNIST